MLARQLFSLRRPAGSSLPSLAVGIALLLAVPILVILASVFTGSVDVWQHLAETVLGDYLINSLLLVLGVAVGVLLIGVPAAWLTSVCDFPLRRFFIWALLLPLAMPAYIIAYTYTGLLDFAGPVQTLLRELTGWRYGEYWFFQIRSLPGAIAMLTLVLYPYVYLMARAAFLEQSASILEAGRLMGYSQRQNFFRLTLPMARPAIVAGLTLALMETLADYGTVQYFGVSTFTTGIFRTFYGFGDTHAAAQLAAVLLSFVFMLIVLERYSRRKLRYQTKKGRPPVLLRLTGRRAALAVCVCAIPVVAGFALPALVMLYWTLTQASVDYDFASLAWNSMYLAFTAALIAVALALVMVYAKRLSQGNHAVATAVNVAGMGYALPGTIIAIGVVIPLAWLDHRIIDTLEALFGVNPGLILSGTLVALLFAYTVRFVAVALGAIDSGMQKIKINLDSAARLMGYRPWAVLRHIHLPLLRTSVLTACLIVFVDVLKELPATLMLRPFDFNTLAVKAYELASDERLIDAAPLSLSIVLVGLLPVILLSRSIQAGHHH